MSIYEERLKILTEHADFQRKLKLSELLKFTQESSIAHNTEYGAGREATLDKGLLWVIGRQRFEISRMPDYDVFVRLRTWPGKTKYFFMPRFYEIVDDKTGELLVRGTAIWSLIDEKARHPIIPSEYGIHIPEESDEFPLPPFPPVPELSRVAAFEVHYGDADLNGHLNNTAYFTKVMDLIPIDYLKHHELKAVDVQYKKEIKLGEVIELSYGLIGDSWWFACERFKIVIEFK